MNSSEPERVLELKTALAHVDGDSQLLSELAAMFVQDYPRLIQEARSSILEKEHAGLERAAHTLKGRLAFFGISLIRNELSRLEAMGRDNDLALASQLLSEIEGRMSLTIMPEFKALAGMQS